MANQTKKPSMSEKINNLPEDLRRYIHDLIACSPADAVQENHALREELEYAKHAVEIADEAYNRILNPALATVELLDGILQFKKELVPGESTIAEAYEALRLAYPELRMLWFLWVGSLPKIVCLCGSTKFKDEYQEANFQFTLAGYIVLSVGAYMHADGLTIAPHQKADLDKLHLRKIDLADLVFVIDKGGYVGDSTQREIAYAIQRNKRIAYWSTHRIPSLEKHATPWQTEGKQPCERR